MKDNNTRVTITEETKDTRVSVTDDKRESGSRLITIFIDLPEDAPVDMLRDLFATAQRILFKAPEV